MWSIGIGVIAGVVASLALRVSHLLSTGGAIAPGIVVALIVFVLLLRKASKGVDPLVAEATKHAQGGRAEMAIKTLKEGLGTAGRWHPLLPAQLHSMIGSIYFDLGKLDEAEASLAKAIRWPWNTKALLGVTRFKKRDEKGMIKAFETAVSVGDKEPLAYTLYAHCLLARGKKDEAVTVLERALKKIPGDERLTNNLELAKAGKKLKTAPYGDKWARFRLDGDTPPLPANVPRHMRGFNPRPGFRQKPIRRR